MWEFPYKLRSKHFGRSRLFLAWQVKRWCQCSELHFAFRRLLRCRWWPCRSRPPQAVALPVCARTASLPGSSQRSSRPGPSPPRLVLFPEVWQQQRCVGRSSWAAQRSARWCWGAEAAELPDGWHSLARPRRSLQHLRRAAHLLSCWNCFPCCCFLGVHLPKWCFLWLQFPWVSLY